MRKVENAFKCLAANEDFLAHFPAQRLKLLLFFRPKSIRPVVPWHCLPSAANYFQVNIFIFTYAVVFAYVKGPCRYFAVVCCLRNALTHFVLAIATSFMPPRLMGCCSLFCLSGAHSTIFLATPTRTQIVVSSWLKFSIRFYDTFRPLPSMQSTLSRLLCILCSAHLGEIGQAALICIPIKFIIYIYFNFHQATRRCADPVLWLVLVNGSKRSQS